ncbi:MAG TPA: hypothetical protein VGD31_18720, partial [Sphingobacteriaceae bacterium]
SLGETHVLPEISSVKWGAPENCITKKADITPPSSDSNSWHRLEHHAMSSDTIKNSSTVTGYTDFWGK